MSNTRSKKSAAVVVANGGGGGAVQAGSIGRIQLKGVLDGLVKRSIHEDKLADGILVDGDVEEGARDLLELNNSDANGVAATVTAVTAGGGNTGGGVVGGASHNRKRPISVRKGGRKRRRKDCIFMSDSSDDEAKKRHIPHVMTLFDRKVDLARFTLTTPIYTMCRDWMSNNPDKLHHHGNYNNPYRNNFTVSGGSDALNHTGEATPIDSTHLPAPIPLPTDGNGQAIRLDIPKPLPSLWTSNADFDKAIKNKSDGDMATYKTAHLKRWKEIRSQWKRASALNQARYTESLKELRDMFQR